MIYSTAPVKQIFFFNGNKNIWVGSRSGEISQEFKYRYLPVYHLNVWF